MKKIIFTLTVCSLCTHSFAQGNAKIAKSSHLESKDSVSGRPEGFPQFVDTGNPVEDEKNYRLAKEKFMTEHYGTEKVKNEQVPNKSVRDRNTVQTPKNIDEKGRKIISKEEFDNYPQEKKDNILAQPSKFIVQ